MIELSEAVADRGAQPTFIGVDHDVLGEDIDERPRNSMGEVLKRELREQLGES